MNKFAYLAALAAVPAMVAPTQAADAEQEVAVVKAACALLFLQVVVDDSSTPAQKAETIETLAQGLENVNRSGVSPDLLSTAIDVVSGVDDEVLENLGTYLVAAVQICEENNYYGSARLRSAVQRFVSVLVAD